MIKSTLLPVCSLVVGCWASEPLVDGLFTDEEWAQLQQLRIADVEHDVCDGMPREQCDAAAYLGQALFFDARLSGPLIVGTAQDPAALGAKDEVGKVACVTCHDPKQYFVDNRRTNISLGANYTGHNALSLVNIGYKADVARRTCGLPPPVGIDICPLVFSWTGRYPTAHDILKIAGLKAPMNSTRTRMAEVIRNDLRYQSLYIAAFGSPMPNVDTCKDTVDPNATCSDADIFNHIELAFERYESRLANPGTSKLDRYLAGEDALSDAAKRGLAVFVGKGMCIDCHGGPLLSDLSFHVTGVPQAGPHVPAIDGGLTKGLVETFNESYPQYEGRFLTPPLRNVAETGPYMHAGQFATLRDVIEFYRKGGGDEGFSGIKDPRLEPLEIDDDDARDLEELLRALTENPVPVGLTVKPEL